MAADASALDALIARLQSGTFIERALSVAAGAIAAATPGAKVSASGRTLVITGRKPKSDAISSALDSALLDAWEQAS